MEQSNAPKVMMMAGEYSGDLLGAALMDEIIENHPDASFFGVGGDEMLKRGLTPVFDMEEINIMGLFEVLPRVPRLLKLFDKLVGEAKAQQPDIFISIDSPDSCLRIAKRVKTECSIPCVHYVSPSVWAWRKKRVFKMAEYLDHVLALFPFEPEIYKSAGLSCTFVGHPVVKRLGHLAPEHSIISVEETKIALLAGSRDGVIKRMAPVMLEAFRQLKAKYADLKAVVPIVHERHKTIILEFAGDMSEYLEFVESDNRFEPIQQCSAALVTSGTSNLEVGMLGVPMVVCYKLGALSHAIISRLVNVPYISPVNWVLGDKAIPELVQNDLTADNLVKQVDAIFSDTEVRQLQIHALQTMRDKLSSGGFTASEKAYDVISTYLK